MVTQRRQLTAELKKRVALDAPPRRSLPDGGFQGTRVSENQSCSSKESKILPPTPVGPVYFSFCSLHHPIRSLKIGLSG